MPSITMWYRITVPAAQTSPELNSLYIPRWHTLGYLTIYANRRLVYSSMADDVFGTFNEAEDGPGGSFYQYSSSHGLRRLDLGGVVIPNSICFSLDGRTMYF